MKTVRDEIDEKFANVSPGHASALTELPDSAQAWVLRLSNGRFGVAVPYSGDIVTEEFAGARLHTMKQGALGPNLPGVLILSSMNEQTRNEFSLICSDFVNPGQDGQLRRTLVEDPHRWWQRWRELLGNALFDTQPHAVLGELLIYEYLLDQSSGWVRWNGPGGASHDLQCGGLDAEVKSTLQRYGSEVQITGQYQLQEGPDTYLFFCRMEPSKHGVCIDSMVKRLVQRHRVSRDELNARLAALGYEEGNSARRKRFVVLEVKRYHVNDEFPRISAQSFVGGAVPTGIRRITYAVDLDVVPGETVMLAPEHYGADALG